MEAKSPAEFLGIQDLPAVTTWREFARHADHCQQCEDLARNARSWPGRPPAALVSACCVVGHQLAMKWITACEQMLSDLNRPRVRPTIASEAPDANGEYHRPGSPAGRREGPS